MAFPSSETGRIEVRVPIACGDGEHDVVLEVCPAGVRVAFNPCDVLPTALRRLSHCTCDRAIAARLAAVERRLQYVWCNENPHGPSADDLPPHAAEEIDAYVQFASGRTTAIARQLLADVDSAPNAASRSAHGDDPAPASDSSPRGSHAGSAACEVSAWARLVCAQHDPAQARSVLAELEILPAPILAAALCGVAWGDDPLQRDLLAQAVLDDRIIPELRARFTLVLAEQGNSNDLPLLVEVLARSQSRQMVTRAAAERGLQQLFARLLHREITAAHTAEAGNTNTHTLAQSTLASVFRAGVEQNCTQALAKCLAGVGPVVFPPLVDYLESHDSPHATMAVNVLSQMADLQAFDVLLRTARGPHAQLNEAARRAILAMGDVLARIGDQAVPHLVDLVHCELGLRFSLFALDTLGIMNSPLAVNALSDVARTSPEAGLRLGALENLGRGNQPWHIEALVSHLAQPRMVLRSAAREALVSVMSCLMGGGAALPALLSLLGACENHDAVSELRDESTTDARPEHPRGGVLIALRDRWRMALAGVWPVSGRAGGIRPRVIRDAEDDWVVMVNSAPRNLQPALRQGLEALCAQ